jgi:hypothetical protein
MEVKGKISKKRGEKPKKGDEYQRRTGGQGGKVQKKTKSKKTPAKTNFLEKKETWT